MIPSFVPLSKIEESLYSLIYQNNSKGYTDIISENFEIYTMILLVIMGVTVIIT
jgi:hypothetical protein